MKAVQRFECKDCGKSPNCPMLRDRVWTLIADKRDILCVACSEKRLGRKIEIADLMPCLGNDWGLVIAKRAVPDLDISAYPAARRVERALQ